MAGRGESLSPNEAQHFLSDPAVVDGLKLRPRTAEGAGVAGLVKFMEDGGDQAVDALRIARDKVRSSSVTESDIK